MPVVVPSTVGIQALAADGAITIMSRRQMKEDSDSEWFETSPQDYLEPKSKPKKLKLLADEQIPLPIVSEIRKAKIDIRGLTSSQRRAPDAGILHFAEQSGRVLLTLDADFWDDRKHPLHQLRTGVIYVSEAPHKHDRVLQAFGLIYGCFGKSFPLDWWNQMKARATVEEFELKIRNWESRVVRYRMKLRGGRLLAKEV